jgi:hypothetical protein
MIVSISRELGAGGETVGTAVAHALGAALLDERAIIAELSRREGFSREQLAERIERPPSLGQSILLDLARAVAMLPVSADVRLPEETIIENVRALVFEYADKGHVVVIGHGGRSLLGWRPPNVRVLAPPDRIAGCRRHPTRRSASDSAGEHRRRARFGARPRRDRSPAPQPGERRASCGPPGARAPRPSASSWPSPSQRGSPQP